MLKFIEKHDVKFVDDRVEIYGELYDVIPKQHINITKPISLDDQNELKDYFLSQGWIPSLYNYKIDPKTKKKLRDDNNELIPTTPKIQETNKICPNLLELEGDLAKDIVKFLSLRNRLGVLSSEKGWMNNPRLNWDGRIGAGASGIASTHRWKHVSIVNVPKAEEGVLLGKEFRSLWTVDEGNYLVSCDAAALEARCQAHWTYPFDGGKTAEILLEKDIHCVNAKAFFPEETKDYDIDSPDFSKDDRGFKPYRSKSKNGGYAVLYGAAPKKLASTLGLPQERGKDLYDAFWVANPALKKLKDTLEKFWIEKGNRKWILAIDGRRLYSRSQHSLINLLFQSTGAIIMNTALLVFHNRMGKLLIDEYGRPYYNYKGHIVKRVIYVHDEWGSEVSKEIAEEIGKIKEECIIKAGQILKLNIPLAGEYKIGNSWSETH